jgi:prepilin-type N-terminal cleavage/methylation domain-containing protein
MNCVKDMQGEPRRRAARGQAGYTLVEVIVGILLLGIMTLSLAAAFSTSFGLVQSAREELRATQILVQKMESIRLYNWTQVNNSTNYLRPSFSDWFDSTATNANARGTFYVGTMTSAPASGLPATYQDAVRAITVTVSWTNYPVWPQRTRVAHSRQMQTYVARNGMQNYIYQ